MVPSECLWFWYFSPFIWICQRSSVTTDHWAYCVWWSRDARNMKQSCCVLSRAIRCYRLPLEKYRLQRTGRITPNLSLNKGRKECGRVCSSCRSALMQHTFRPKNFTPVASSSLWDPSLSSSRTWFGMSARARLRVSVCSCAPPLLPGPESSAQLRMRTQAPHCAQFLWRRVTIDLEVFVCQGNRQHVSQRRSHLNQRALDHRRHATPATSVLAEPRTAKQQEGNKGRGQSREYSESNLSGEPLSRQHCLYCPVLLEGSVGWGLADGRAGSQLVTVRDDHTKAWGGSSHGAPAKISMLTAGLDSWGLSGFSPLAPLTSVVLSLKPTHTHAGRTYRGACFLLLGWLKPADTFRELSEKVWKHIQHKSKCTCTQFEPLLIEIEILQLHCPFDTSFTFPSLKCLVLIVREHTHT